MSCVWLSQRVYGSVVKVSKVLKFQKQFLLISETQENQKGHITQGSQSGRNQKGSITRGGIKGFFFPYAVNLVQKIMIFTEDLVKIPKNVVKLRNKILFCCGPNVRPLLSHATLVIARPTLKCMIH